MRSPKGRLSDIGRVFFFLTANCRMQAPQCGLEVEMMKWPDFQSQPMDTLLQDIGVVVG